MNNKTISLPVELVDKAVNGYVQEQGHALNAIRELLAEYLSNQSAPAAKDGSEDRHLSVLALHDVMQSAPSSSLYSLAEAVLDAGYSKAEQPAPVAVVLPDARESLEHFMLSMPDDAAAFEGPYSSAHNNAALFYWKACLDVVARLNGVK